MLHSCYPPRKVIKHFIVVLFILSSSSTYASYWNVTIGSWGLSGSGPYTAGQTMGVSLSVCANRNASHNIPIDIYLSWDNQGYTDTLLTSTSRYIHQPGSYCSVGSTTNFTLPNTPPGTPHYPCYPSRTWYILLKHNGTVLRAIPFTVKQPSIKSINASSAFVGAQITVKGTDLEHLKYVNFYQTPSLRIPATINSSSSSSVTFTVPTGATTGTIQLAGSCFYLYTGSVTILPSYLTSFTPKAAIENAPITITGNGFLGATSVKFQGTSANFIIEDQFTITAYMPVGAASTGTISVEAGNTATSTESYEKTSCTPFAYASFEEDLPTWSSYNDDNSTTFQIISGLGGFNASSQCFGINNFGYNSPGSFDGIISPDFCLSNINSLSLSFDVAYAYYSSTNFERLYVFYALNGSSSYSYLWSKSGATLATGGVQTSSFVPSSAQWRTETIDLSTLIGANTSIQLLIVQENGHGNNLFLDNIRMGTSPVVWSSLDVETWNTASAWSSGSVPTSSDDVLITKSAVVPKLDANVSVLDFYMEDGAELVLNAGKTLSVNGNINGTSAAITGTGYLDMSGNALQNLSIDSIPNLEISNSKGVSLGDDLKINQRLVLATGLLNLNDFDLTLADNVVLSRYNEDSYIATTGSGKLMRNVSSTATVFPIGTASSYNPLELQNSGTTDLFSVRIGEGVYTNGTGGTRLTSDVVDRTWFIEEGTTGGSNVSLTLQWNASEELTGFDRTKSGIGHYSGSAWIQQATGAASAGSVTNSWKRTHTGLTSFSPFGVGDNNGPLPVELFSFNGTRLGRSKVRLSWSTATELNNYGFYVERMAEWQSDFETIGFVHGMGTSFSENSYSFIDNGATNKLTYYRLKQVDHDGTSEHSNVVSIDKETDSGKSDVFQLAIAANGDLVISAPNNPMASLKIFDFSGKMMFSQNRFSNTIVNSADWPKGVYLIQGLDETGRISIVKLFI